MINRLMKIIAIKCSTAHQFHTFYYWITYSLHRYKHTQPSLILCCW